MLIESGISIVISMDGESVRVIEAGWCKVDHQSTDFLIMGKLIVPIITKIDINLSDLSKLLKELCKVISPKYIRNNINVDVILASHCHQVPQVGMPQTEPEKSARNVESSPIYAADLIR